ncbi:hypothetical protein CMI37_23105 [Candidatus Pacearchaeota archaeon]|nr:hypothetical protein [Candidatus Pacearchaeota archaeon]|tara:strand:+ start:1183 stop:1395 length:213 start_codon:yes stop_codon:yes gene_type:complete
MPTDPAVKPGYKTTEFWLISIAEIVGLLLASGAITEVGEGPIPRIIGGVIAILGALGYAVNRNKLKNDGI